MPRTPKTPWRNKIVGHGEEPVDQLVANPRNWKIHTQEAQQALLAAIHEIGFIRSVTVNRTTGFVLDGHERIMVAMRDGQPTVPVEYVELTEEEELKALLTMDPLGAMQQADPQLLRDNLADVSIDDAALQAVLDQLRLDNDLVDMLPGASTEPSPPRDDLGPRDNIDQTWAQWQTESGQLWQLGDHKLICGDCCDQEIVDKLVEHDEIDMMFTDPPYGVSYSDKNKFLSEYEEACGKIRSNRIHRLIEGDNLTPDQMYDLWLAAFTNMLHIAKPGASYYICGPGGTQLQRYLLNALYESGWQLKHTIIWAKNNFVFGRTNYHYKHEPVLFGWKQGKHAWYGGTSEHTVWEIDRPLKSKLHPTMKPVELVERALGNSSQSGDLVIDPFAGSGSTLVACERTGRRCLSMEKTPEYTAIILQRWADLTGNTPERLH